MAETDSNSNFDYVQRYHQALWGDLIYGTEKQLKALGLGADKAYPVRYNKGLYVVDPRGFKTAIHLSSQSEGIYDASISFPNRRNPIHEKKYEEFAKGVRLERSLWYDEYFGSEVDLLNAGLVRPEHIPSENGIAKVQVTLDGNGIPRKGKVNVFYGGKGKQGAKQITKLHKDKLRIRVIVSEEVEAQRREMSDAIDRAWEREMSVLPRPRPLTPQDGLKHNHKVALKDKSFQNFMLNTMRPVLED